MDYKEKVIALLNSQELPKEQKEKLEDIFPELKESEDEKIRKSLIGHLKECRNNTRSEVMINEYAKWIAWLEKQGGPKLKTPQWMIDFLDDLRSHIGSPMDHDERREVDGKLLAIKNYLDFKYKENDTLSEQNLDWSEEDEEMLTAFLHKVEVCDLLTNRESVWVTKRLKSLRPQNTWKPSDEQINALEYYIYSNSPTATITKGTVFGNIMVELLEQLKKLK